jgi:hypothetical protein
LVLALSAVRGTHKWKPGMLLYEGASGLSAIWSSVHFSVDPNRALVFPIERVPNREKKSPITSARS